MATKTSYTQSGGRGQGSKRGGKMPVTTQPPRDGRNGGGMKPFGGNASANPGRKGK